MAKKSLTRRNNSTGKPRVAAKKKKPTPRSSKRLGARGATRKIPRRSKSTTPSVATRNPFARLARTDGMGACIVVGERVEGRWELLRVVEEIPVGTASGVTGRPFVRLRRRARAVAELMAAAGHPQRIAILVTLLERPATYASLQRATSLKAGPLYHHINHLRLAGLILPKQRDLYEMTRAGRNLLLIAAATSMVARDRRRRPL